MRHSPVMSLVLLTLVATACSATERTSPPQLASSAGSGQSSAAPSASDSERLPLPSGFPVLSDAVAAAMPPGDPGLIGLWESDQVGSAAYDFYVEALPAAGYPIVGLYPGGDVALIRFRAPSGGVWQLVAHASGDGRTAIEVRLDRP